MKFRGIWLPLLAAALLAPGAVRAQEDEEDRRPGMIGISFDTGDGDDVDGVRIIEVRRGGPADEAGIREGDVVIRLNGSSAIEAFRTLPATLEEGDSVRLRIRRGGDERDVVVVAERRPGTRFGFVRPGPGERPMIFFDRDSMEFPLEALTMRIDSLHTRLLHLDSGMVRVQLDSLVHLFNDSARVFIQRMPNVELRLEGPELEALRLEGRLEGLDEELEAQLFRLDELGGELEGLGEQPFFMELGRRAAAGAELAEMNEGLGRYFDGLTEGALVIEVAPNTPAARAGLQPGDVILRAGGREVDGPEDVRRALMAAEDGEVVLEVQRQGRRRELTLEWDGRDRVIRTIRPGRVEVAPRRAPRN
ncbi:MAG TPA: PDZ domain-containing protein [Longimicrobium sp.]|nr:PDZ domain-containing protein [Longimicrobium sp.]